MDSFSTFSALVAPTNSLHIVVDTAEDKEGEQDVSDEDECGPTENQINQHSESQQFQDTVNTVGYAEAVVDVINGGEENG